MLTNKTKKYKLECELDHDYFLIGIHTVLEDFRLAYFLNKTLNICLKRNRKDIVFKHKKGLFSNYDFEDNSNFCYWNLIGNKQVIAEEVSSNQINLFQEISNTFILIPELKRVDFFLKIEGDYSKNKIQEFTREINLIHRVMTTQQINPESLKSKDFLIY